MAAFMPAWRPLDATHSARLLSERPRGGRIVALCVAPGLAGRPEGARLAMALARRWTEEGMSVVLTDGDVAHPMLHLALGVANAKGLADILLVGNAWEPLALPTPTPGLRLIPAGGGAAATASDAARERLDDLCREVPDEGVTFALYVPLGSMVAEWVIEACTDIVVLSREKEPIATFFAADEDRIRAHVGPPLAREGRAAQPAMPPGVTRPAAAPEGAGTRPAPPGPAPSQPAPPRPPAPQPVPPPPVPPRPAPPEERAPRRPVDEDRAGSSASRREDKWAQAAAQLRAQKKPGAPGNGDKPTGAVEPTAEPRAVPQAPPEPTSEPKARPRTDRPAEPWRGARRPATSQPPAPRPTEPPRAAPGPAEPVGPLLGVAPPVAAAEPPSVAKGAEHVDREKEDREGRRAQGRKVAVRVVAALVGIAVVAGGVWIWTKTRGVPPYEAGSTPLPRASLPAAEAPVPATTPAETTEGLSGDLPPAVTRAPHQRWSWSIAAMGTLEAARSLSERLRRAAPDETFMVAPVVSGGRTLYRVLGGLAPDQERLVGTRESLGRETGVASGGWLAREAPLAFALRDFEDAQAAATWAGELWDEGIPVYVLVVERDDGSVVHRVYSGAYGSEEEAAPLRAVLENAGIGPGALSERRGQGGS